jgi:hypothetical protein
MSNLLEIYDLLEWADPTYTKLFWADAKEGKLNDRAFNLAYKEELVNLGLWSLIDEESYAYLNRRSLARYPSNTGVLKEKSSYGAIKKAAEENPDSWAVKALLKMWVLQFKDGVKSNSQIKREEGIAADDERKKQVEKERTEREAQAAAREAKRKEVEAEHIPFVLDVANKVATKYAAAKKEEAKTTVEKLLKLKDEIERLSQGLITIYDRGSDQTFLKELDGELVTVHALVLMSGSDTEDFRIRVIIDKFLGKEYNTYNSDYKDRSFDLATDELTEDVITKKVLEVLEAVSKNRLRVVENSLATRQNELDEINRKFSAAKAAQAAVDAGKPVDPDFIPEILSIFTRGLKGAQREADIWSDSTSDNIGVAFHLKKQDTLSAAGLALLHCNWRSYVGEREIAVYRMTDGIDALYDAVDATFDAICPELNIEVIK